MERKTYLRLMVFFLGFSYLLSSTVIAATRSLKSNNEVPSSVQELLVQDATMEMSDTKLLGMSENDIQGRMVLKKTDYPGSEANIHHDPETPGRV